MQKLVYVSEQGLSGTAGTVFTALRLLVAAFFLFMAWKNLSGDAGIAADFERWGYPGWFRSVTAGLQIVGAVALVIPALSFLGALLLLLVLLGAVATHLIHDPPASAASALVFLGVLGVLLVAYRPPGLR